MVDTVGPTTPIELIEEVYGRFPDAVLQSRGLVSHARGRRKSGWNFARSANSVGGISGIPAITEINRLLAYLVAALTTVSGFHYCFVTARRLSS